MAKDKFQRLKKIGLFFLLLFFIPLITTLILWVLFFDRKEVGYETLFIICEISFIVTYLCRPLFVKIFKPSSNLKKYAGLFLLYLLIITLLIFL